MAVSTSPARSYGASVVVKIKMLDKCELAAPGAASSPATFHQQSLCMYLHVQCTRRNCAETVRAQLTDLPLLNSACSCTVLAPAQCITLAQRKSVQAQPTNVADDGRNESRLVLQVEVVLLEGQVALAQGCKEGLHLLAGQGSCTCHQALHF